MCGVVNNSRLRWMRDLMRGLEAERPLPVRDNSTYTRSLVRGSSENPPTDSVSTMTPNPDEKVCRGFEGGV